jgi:hypothetical protein
VRPQNLVGSSRIADRELEEAKHAEVLKPEDLVSAALRKLDPARRGSTGLLDVPEMRVDERPCIEEGAQVLLSADLLGALIPLRRFSPGERPVAGAELELCLVKEGSRHRSFVSDRDRPLEQQVHPGACLVESSGEHQPHAQREARTAGVVDPLPHSRVLEDDRTLEQSGHRLDGRQRLEPGDRGERTRENRAIAGALRRLQGRPRMIERLVGGAPHEQKLTDVALELRNAGVVTASVVERPLRELEAALEALLCARKQEQGVRSRTTR